MSQILNDTGLNEVGEMIIEAETVRGILAVFLGFGTLALMACIFYTIYYWMTNKK